MQHITSLSVDGYWLSWLDWSTCSVSCAEGSRNRSRTCIEPLHGGLECIEDAAESESCNEVECPSKLLNDMYTFSSCSVCVLELMA